MAAAQGEDCCFTSITSKESMHQGQVSCRGAYIFMDTGRKSSLLDSTKDVMRL